MKIALPILFCFLSFCSYGQKEKLIEVYKRVELMGSRFEITVVAPNDEIGYFYIDAGIAEIRRIENLISSWDEASETSLINRNAGIQPVKVSLELFQLIERAKHISKITDGAFDISYASIDNIWRFDGSMKYMPTREEIQKSVKKVGYKKIILNKKETTVFLKNKEMKIGFGAIGKGYAADMVKKLLISKEVDAGIINASGDLTTWGYKVNGKKWLIGITNPLSKNKLFSWLPIIESSVATSGNYEKYVTFKGKKYSHIIDPRTGYPSSGIISVSVLAKSAELCDALATSVFIMGTDSGIAMINQLKGAEVILVDSDNKVHKSKGVLFDKNQ